MSSRITLAICVLMAGVGDNRRLSWRTGFLAISDMLFSPSFHLGGVTVVIFSIDWHNSFIWDTLTRGFDPEAGFPFVSTAVYLHVIGILPILVRHCIVKSQGGCRCGLSNVTVSCRLAMRRVMLAPHLGVRSLCACEGSLYLPLSVCLCEATDNTLHSFD